MTSTDAIVRMIKAINEDNEADFYQVAHEFCNTLAYGGDNRARITGAIRLKPTRLRRLDNLPSNIKNLIIQGEQKSENVFLTDEISAFIKILLLEWANMESYRVHNIQPRNKILLHGPTGNGKTTIARYIARTTNLPFIEINSDLVVDSHIGQTSGNIHNILSNIQESCILFWDEVDTIGYKRSGNDKAADRENDRMVNSILINMEKLDYNVIFIGATNRLDILDAAFLRRFDVKLEIPLPTLSQKLKYTEQLLEYYTLSEQIAIPSLIDLNSYSEIKLKITELAREYIISILKLEP